MGGLAPRMALITAAIFIRFGRAPTTQSTGAAAVRDGMSIFRGMLLVQDGNEEQALHAQHWDPHCMVGTAMFAGVRRKVNDGHEISGTFRVGMPKFVAPGSIFTTFGSGLPN
jgi:hypothetical protein